MAWNLMVKVGLRGNMCLKGNLEQPFGLEVVFLDLLWVSKV